MLSDEITRAATHFSLLDHSPIGHFVLRSDYTVLFWNRCLEAWTGIPRESLVGYRIADRFPHLLLPKYANRIQNLFEGGPPAIFSSQLHRHTIPAPLPGGKFRFQHTVVTGVPIPKGKGCYALFSIQDVTSLTEAIENHGSALKRTLVEMEVRRRAETELLRSSKELKKLNDLLKERAIRDGLTGLHNHRYFYQTLRRDFLLARRHNSDLSCLLLDLDHFKDVNDRYGHPFGDKVLKGVASEIRKKVRETDLVCRYGGEEFAVLLPGTDAEGAMDVAEEIRTRIANKVFTYANQAVKVTVSIGLASVVTHSPELPHDLLGYADKALYRAKAAGRNRVLTFCVDFDYVSL
jgi:diguanylate cyclase